MESNKNNILGFSGTRASMLVNLARSINSKNSPIENNKTENRFRPKPSDLFQCIGLDNIGIDFPTKNILQPVSVEDRPTTVNDTGLTYTDLTTPSSSNSNVGLPDNPEICFRDKTHHDDLLMNFEESVEIRPNEQSLVSNESEHLSPVRHALIELPHEANLAEKVIEEDQPPEKGYTKKGTPRLRKKSTYTKHEKDNLRKDKYINKHKTKLPCVNCRLKCVDNITDNLREDINKKFNELEWKERRNFILNYCEKTGVKRRRGNEDSKRQYSLKYFFKNEEGLRVQVCKTFFLTSLGFTKHNDTVVHNVMSKISNRGEVIVSKTDRRGQAPNPKKIDRDLIKKHIESYNPAISHYRREHAPNVRYLPNDITIKEMHEDFKSKYSTHISYDLYRSVLRSMKISFTKLGNEECEQCEEYGIHKSTHGISDNETGECNDCQSYQKHKNQYTNARLEYQQDSELSINDTSTAYYSADLQKVVMLPRMEGFKVVVFTRRIIVFNESFVPLKKTTKNNLPVAIIWHEGVSGRKKEDIISAFHAFFKINRDMKNVVLWLDNCSAQNKSWAFLSFLSYIVNSTDMLLERLCIKYFEPGHSFMSADSFHHQVELAMKHEGKNMIYDFTDFEKSVKSSNSGKVIVKSMNVSDFSVWPDHCSITKVRKNQSNPHLRDIVQLEARRGELNLFYKTEFSEEYKELDFLKSKVTKTGKIKPPEVLKAARGIQEDKKVDIIKKLLPLMPENRRPFWLNLPASQTTADLLTNNDDDPQS